MCNTITLGTASSAYGSLALSVRGDPGLPSVSTGVRLCAVGKNQPEKVVMEATTPLIPGDILDDRYCIDGLIAQGGMSVVYDAHHRLLQHRLAIKVLEGIDSLSHGSILAEARVAATLDSEHSVRVLDVGTLPSGEPFLVMERLSGMDLSQFLRANGALPIPQALTIALQVCHALAEAHVLGIVHRDIKPSNVFLCRRPDGSSVVKVLDFGVACALRTWDSSNPGDLCMVGSPGYAAPEQLESGASIDQRTDVFSLGVLLYELLTGTRAFNLESLAEAMLVVSRDEPAPMPASIPRELQGIVLRCMAKHREQRYQSVAEVASELAHFAPFLEAAALRVEEVTDRTRRWLPLDSGESSSTVPSIERTATLSRSEAPPNRVPSKTPRKSAPAPLLVAQILPTSNWIKRLLVTCTVSAVIVASGVAAHSFLRSKLAPLPMPSTSNPQAPTSSLPAAIPVSARTPSVSIVPVDPAKPINNAGGSAQPSALSHKAPDSRR